MKTYNKMFKSSESVDEKKEAIVEETPKTVEASPEKKEGLFEKILGEEKKEEPIKAKQVNNTYEGKITGFDLVNVRSTPNGVVQFQVSKGQMVDILRDEVEAKDGTKWYMIKSRGEDSKTGFIMSKYVIKSLKE